MVRTVLPLALLALITTLATPAPAQAGKPQPAARKPTQPNAQPATQPPTPDPKDWGVHLAQDPLEVEGVGVTISIPLDAVVQHDVYETIATTKVILPENLGVVVIQERRSKRLDLETTEVADEILTQLLELAPRFTTYDKDSGRLVASPDGQPVGTRAHIVSRDKEFKVDGVPADHAYVAIPREGTNEFTIRGSTLLKTDPGRFILFELYSSLTEFRHSREMYEVMLATVHLTDPADIASDRAAAIDAGVKALAQLSESDYAEIFGQGAKRWERLSRPASTGSVGDEEELGYRCVRASIGKRGELSPNKPKEKWTADDQQSGYIVQIDARLLDLGGIVDTRAAYFLSLDRNEEAWVVNMAIRKDGDVSRWQEIGARMGTDMSINIVPESSQAQKIRPQIQGEGYISMVESFMLPQLLMHIGIPADFAFYSYQTSSSTIRLRTDGLTPPAKSGGNWTLTTRLNADAPPQTTVLTEEGTIVRTDLADGRRWTPIEFEQLFRLWKSKNLPLD